MCYVAICTRCGHRQEVLTQRAYLSGELIEHERCERCGRPLRRAGIADNAPPRLKKCWEGYKLEDM